MTAILVADFAAVAAPMSARELVAAAAERGARFVAADVVDGDDETPDAHVGGRRVASLERLGAEALRRQVGLFLRLRDTLTVDGLASALGAAAKSPATALRERVVVVVDAERAGKKLRRIAPQLPSAYELSASRSRGFSRLLPPNLLRACADADDLVVPWGRIGAAELASRIAPMLARRGARLWVSEVPEADLDRATAVPAAGFVVRCAPDGPPLGGQTPSSRP